MRSMLPQSYNAGKPENLASGEIVQYMNDRKAMTEQSRHARTNFQSWRSNQEGCVEEVLLHRRRGNRRKIRCIASYVTQIRYIKPRR